MGALDRILDVLPPPYTVEPGSVLHQMLDALALELDAYAEDLYRMQRTHWFDLAYRVSDLDRLAALVGARRLPWETLALFHDRVAALVAARLRGSVGPAAIRELVFTLVSRIEEDLGAVLVPGLPRVDENGAGEEGAVDRAYADDPGRPHWVPLRLVENPSRRVRSRALEERGGAVPYLFRWTDSNAGLDPAPVTVTVVGRSGGSTAIPLIANLTTGHAVGYAGVLPVGARLTIGPASGDGSGDASGNGGEGDGDQEGGEDARAARAVLDTGSGVHDVTDRVFSLSGFRLGVPFHLDGEGPGGPDRPGPLLPLQNRGANEWTYASGAVYGTPGLDATYLQMADETLREAVLDETAFDHALFPGGPRATVSLTWTEHEPAAFTVVVPHGIVALPVSLRASEDEVVAALASDVSELRAAGVRSRLELRPFIERQPQRSRVRLPWIRPPRQRASAGTRDELSTGARFGESAFGRSRLE
ncbi:hypothetical protein [Actinomadura sp. HBU206391]|uniref:hypothetical protein n=1 Tax=Actinomadura sp. HBU206391 TaxID=2731692 RepID=UPI0016501A2E|nr:hypothetical protein [Actinomadura sp. HBU206391]MBC6459917.1 hypothetical protein [Actinomadura sp. HBU206391]